MITDSGAPEGTKTAESAPRVLVVDDNEDVVELLELLLTHHGLNVLKAYGGQESLELARSEPVDLVVLDVMMPGTDGLTVCRELKRDYPSLPIILLTARDDMATRSQAMSLGVCEFVTKPVDNHDLLKRIQTQLKNREWEKEMDLVDSTIEARSKPVKLSKRYRP
jgi:DNA-binding response OmpR family regulator